MNYLPSSMSALGLWDLPTKPCTSKQAAVGLGLPSMRTQLASHQSKLSKSDKPSPGIEAVLPFADADIGDFPAPAKPILKPGLLKDMYFVLPSGVIFKDKMLPRPEVDLVKHKKFDVQYFISLHEQTA